MKDITETDHLSETIVLIFHMFIAVIFNFTAQSEDPALEGII